METRISVLQVLTTQYSLGNVLFQLFSSGKNRSCGKRRWCGILFGAIIIQEKIFMTKILYEVDGWKKQNDEIW